MKTINDFKLKKQKKEKITMVTCYDYNTAKILSDTQIDTLLVGDSVSQVVHGFPSTLHATIEMMMMHTSAVARGTANKFIVADMPFMTTRKSTDYAMECVQKLMLAGAQAIKIENIDGHFDLIKHIVESGVPVMGHLGLTPQSIHQLGGPKIQGKTHEQADKITNDALLMQKAGCFSLVLECVPAKLALDITQKLDIPTIGIGAGAGTDGQVLVINDLLGMQPDFNPKFLKKYHNLNQDIIKAVNAYASEVTELKFPLTENEY
ncbi:MAG: 3-methyl-2-oxobutanoate hydroxymethyltransferase [Pseudobdellovibrio sp.]